MTRATHKDGTAQMLFLALELAKSSWLVAATDRNGAKAIHQRLNAGDLRGLEQFLVRVKKRLDLAPDAEVCSCYEAGRDGFWLHRALVERSIFNRVLDPSSIEVPRRQKHAKTDRLDAGKLLALLLRLERGERAARVVVVPTPEQEDARQQHRERDRLQSAFNATRSQIEGLFAAQGVNVEPRRLDVDMLDQIRLHNDVPLPANLLRRLKRAFERAEFLHKQILAIDRELRAAFREQERLEQVHANDDSVPVDGAIMLHQLVGIGSFGAHVLNRELFWRDFNNRREVAACTGLVPVPQLSGEGGHQGSISKAGNPRIRRLLVELAWFWTRYQPHSALTKWFHQRFGEGKRNRRIGIVALARKLVVALWRYLKHGVVPEGAVLRAA